MRCFLVAPPEIVRTSPRISATSIYFYVQLETLKSAWGLCSGGARGSGSAHAAPPSTIQAEAEVALP